jgi:tRNA-2-methylthio-N6-dimethylallyladenosine synthase
LQLTGRTMTDHIVVFDGDDRLTGHTVSVRIEDASAFTLFGRETTMKGCSISVRELRPSSGVLTARSGGVRRVSLPLV